MLFCPPNLTLYRPISLQLEDWLVQFKFTKSKDIYYNIYIAQNMGLIGRAFHSSILINRAKLRQTQGKAKAKRYMPPLKPCLKRPSTRQFCRRCSFPLLRLVRNSKRPRKITKTGLPTRPLRMVPWLGYKQRY
ncbi:hypothetical protein Salmi_Mp123 (mitochondrion) [Salvia miltiorrhiza]|uniref:Uncharacterized protein n=1 Tax=Salvia miltiorrhiza TaxID=226208 RepID=V9P518_SALMI|nr:hypothetical protein Salmi_Mp123 [Salvia miltiorrhiza]AGU16651.1 hypothetical protein Salmi_Mp123 [Salvia miltiorrhiza]